ncbi:MAG: RNA-binding domain-containing protein [Candidatus Thalassarchaeaceae archaeon]|nr:RNA-binding domain-containing protein [Candidatus Thalassarchaeaceae archaeon]
MGLHSVSWRVNVSALDRIKLIEDSLKWIAGEKSSIEITKDKSFHGAEQFTIVAKNMKKKDSRKSLERLGRDVLKELLENNIRLRIDEDKNFYVRLKLSELVKGEISLANRNTISSTVKGKFKIESYPGDSTIDVISNLIKELI